MRLVELLDERRCTIALESRDKQGCIAELADLMAASELQVSREVIHNALLERERLGSTGFENGVAIPHARLPGDVGFALGVAVSRRGVPFESADGKRAMLFFVLVGPEEEPQQYLRYLAHISRLGLNRAARDELRTAPTRAALRDAVNARLQPVEPAGAASSETRKLVIITLYELRYLDDVVTLFIEQDIQGASITESTGLRDILTNVPLFGDFLNFLGERSEASRTITAVVSAEQLPRLVAGLEQIVGDLDTHSGAAVMAVDLAFSKGSLGVV